MVMRISAGTAVSRIEPDITGGFMFTDTACLTEACID
jgi:hypothetical protein